MHVYSDSRTVELFSDGISQGKSSIVSPALGGPSFGQFIIAHRPHNLTAVGLDGTGQQQSVHTVIAEGAAYAVVLGIDAPSPATRTGSALVADGQVQIIYLSYLNIIYVYICVCVYNTIVFFRVLIYRCMVLINAAFAIPYGIRMLGCYGPLLLTITATLFTIRPLTSHLVCCLGREGSSAATTVRGKHLAALAISNQV